MKRSDIIAIGTVCSVLAFFSFVPGAMETFEYLSKHHGYSMSFVKFAVLATFGECLALRLVIGAYDRPGFGVLPKMLVWGLLGVIINGAFSIFAVGVPALLGAMGLGVSSATLASGPLGLKLLTAFAVSATLNCVFGPWMMTLHKVTDTHISDTGGTLAGALRPMDVAGILRRIDWDIMWNFVFRKTIPFFWIPAHTITFMLPGEFQMLFAAALGIMLGLILAFAATRRSA